MAFVVNYFCSFWLSAPINYSNYRNVSKATKYSDEFQGTFGPAAPSAK